MNILLSLILFFIPIYGLSQEAKPNNERTNEVTFFDIKSSLKGVLNNHKMITATKNDIEAAKFRVKQARGGFFPTFDLTGNYGHENIIKHGQMNNTGMMARDTAKIPLETLQIWFTRSGQNLQTLSFGKLAMQKQIINDVLLRAITAYLRVIQARKCEVCCTICKQYKKTNRIRRRSSLSGRINFRCSSSKNSIVVLKRDKFSLRCS